jgi:hypothetical protein
MTTALPRVLYVAKPDHLSLACLVKCRKTVPCERCLFLPYNKIFFRVAHERSDAEPREAPSTSPWFGRS